MHLCLCRNIVYGYDVSCNIWKIEGKIYKQKKVRGNMGYEKNSFSS